MCATASKEFVANKENLREKWFDVISTKMRSYLELACNSRTGLSHSKTERSYALQTRSLEKSKKGEIETIVAFKNERSGEVVHNLLEKALREPINQRATRLFNNSFAPTEVSHRARSPFFPCRTGTVFNMQTFKCLASLPY